MYKGETSGNGEYFSVEDDVQEKRPFKAFLDVGLVHATVGQRVFGALKGACDGGIYIPHNTKRFPGFTKNADSGDTYDAAVHRERIFGAHVDKYMAQLKEDSQEDFDR
jgi:large subunit ribosomal protein L5e